MKIFPRFFAAMLLVASALPALATDASESTSASSPHSSSVRRADIPHKAALPRLRAKARTRAQLAERLGLTAEQRAQLKAKRSSTVAAAKAIRQDPDLSPDQKRAKLRETARTARTEMRSVLTPEQQTKLERLRRGAQRAHRAAHRRAAP